MTILGRLQDKGIRTRQVRTKRACTRRENISTEDNETPATMKRCLWAAVEDMSQLSLRASCDVLYPIRVCAGYRKGSGYNGREMSHTTTGRTRKSTRPVNPVIKCQRIDSGSRTRIGFECYLQVASVGGSNDVQALPTLILNFKSGQTTHTVCYKLYLQPKAPRSSNRKSLLSQWHSSPLWCMFWWRHSSWRNIDII